MQAASFLAEMARYGATDVWDFTTQQYIRGGTVGASGLTFTRASAGYAQRVDGRWELFGSGVPRITDRGLLIEGSRINRALFSRDLTNPAWTATNVTVARNQVGIDGTANSACSLTATAGNGTVLQAVTHASTARFFSVWVRRLTGTGTVEVTLDNGATWTAVTVTSAWTRVGAAQTLANPTVGVRLVTSGDAIAVDFAQLEDGGFATSPILVEGTAVTRAADLTNTPLTLPYAASIYCEFSVNTITNATQAFLVLDSGGNNDEVYVWINNNATVRMITETGSALQSNLTQVGTVAVDTVYRTAGRIQTNDFVLARNGTLGAADTSGTVPATSTRAIFGNRFGNLDFSFGYIRRAALITRALTDAELQGITA